MVLSSQSALWVSHWSAGTTGRKIHWAPRTVPDTELNLVFINKLETEIYLDLLILATFTCKQSSIFIKLTCHITPLTSIPQRLPTLLFSVQILHLGLQDPVQSDTCLPPIAYTTTSNLCDLCHTTRDSYLPQGLYMCYSLGKRGKLPGRFYLSF